MASTEDRHRVVSVAEYTQLCDDLRSLVKSWGEQLGVPESLAACVLLQIGATIAQWQDMSLDTTLEYVRQAWATAREVPEEDFRWA
jgi:hypothetical protein